MIETVAVIGGGTMGRGIAQAAALAGHRVFLYDITDDLLAQARMRIFDAIDKGVARGKVSAADAAHARSALTFTASYDFAAHCDLIIEAVPEDMALKRRIFRRLDEEAPSRAILASNTSSLSINALAAATQRPESFLGLHFFNPAHIMKLVEVIRADFTAPEVLDRAVAFVRGLGKTPVLCQDTPAFIVNRVARPFYGEAFRLLGEQAADVADIDKLARSLGFRMGPFELIDLIGCDVNLAVTQSVYDAYFQDPKYRPHPLQRRMVESNRLGRKTQHGFYDYRPGRS
ncbi:MAG: 3-hydroxybutyryl-CoA dehydrogenase [Anaerolineales bacterium]|nr:3-hydroxybutyryl-CoA dehydrogenase [Anaerolineales bacterium]MCB8951855.1 3-hydroxybutyryl-CoA dehydrogenase [Ardenticatenales bacterium]